MCLSWPCLQSLCAFCRSELGPSSSERTCSCRETLVCCPWRQIWSSTAASQSLSAAAATSSGFPGRQACSLECCSISECHRSFAPRQPSLPACSPLPQSSRSRQELQASTGQTSFARGSPWHTEAFCRETCPRLPN